MRTGGCFCRAVKYTVSDEPINVRVCHCQDCQRLTGSAFFVRALFSRNSVTVTGAVDEIASSEDLLRNFCPKCGSLVFCWRKSRPDRLAIALGSFDDLHGLRPSEQIWLRDKQPWIDLALPGTT